MKKKKKFFKNHIHLVENQKLSQSINSPPTTLTCGARSNWSRGLLGRVKPFGSGSFSIPSYSLFSRKPDPTALDLSQILPDTGAQSATKPHRIFLTKIPSFPADNSHLPQSSPPLNWISPGGHYRHFPSQKNATTRCRMTQAD